MQDDFYDKNMLLKYDAVIMLISIITGNWLVTQKIAATCEYSDVLKGFYFTLGDMRLYEPFANYFWKHDALLQGLIPHVLIQHNLWLWSFVLLGMGCCYIVHKKHEVLSSHGTASFAKAKDIKDMGLNPTTSGANSGVVVGRNPFDDTLLVDDGPAHVFLAAPTRTGKGVGIIIPTGIIWRHSIFFFDPKAELWVATAGFRKHKLGQKVMKFEPLCKDGSSASWNPYAEINFQTFEEMSDVKTINETMVKTGEGSNKDPFWDNSAITLLNGVVLHLLYKNCQEKRELPCPTDAMSFISSPTMDTDHLYSSMKVYAHISPEEFMEEDGLKNPLKEIYGTYIPDMKPYVEALKKLKDNALTENEENDILHLPISDPKENARVAFENLRRSIIKRKEEINWKAPDITFCRDKVEIDGVISMAMQSSPFFQLLVHPKVAECAANIVNNAKETRESIIGSAKTALSLYQDPLIKRNTAVSDFCFKDLLDPKQAISLYLVLQPNDVDKLRPLTRLFVNTMLAKTVRDMKFDVPMEKKQRLLMLLDEFPQLKKMETIENTLAICAGYGVKICTVVQSVTQINQIYTKDNSILDNSQIQIYMTPSNIAQAKELSEIMGDKTIKEQNESGKGVMDKSTSESKIARKLMNPDEILKMSKKKELVMVQGAKPILAKKIYWFNEPFFKKRVYDPKKKSGYPNPVYSDVCTEVKTYEQLFQVHKPEVDDVVKAQKAVEAARQRENNKHFSQNHLQQMLDLIPKEKESETHTETTANNESLDNRAKTGTVTENATEGNTDCGITDGFDAESWPTGAEKDKINNSVFTDEYRQLLEEKNVDDTLDVQHGHPDSEKSSANKAFSEWQEARKAKKEANADGSGNTGTEKDS